MIATLSRAPGFCKNSLPALAFVAFAFAMAAPAGANDLAIKALQSYEKGDVKSAEQQIARAHDPVATKLYYWLVFQNDKSGINHARLRQFISYNPGWPNQRALRLRAEREMPASVPATEVINWYGDYPPSTASGLDRYMQALLKSGRQKKAQDIIAQWWAETSMSRADQKYIFKLYNKMIPLDSHRKRFDRLLYKGQYSNARAVARVIGRGYPQLAEARIALAQKSGKVDALIASVPQSLQRDPGLLYERLRWRRRKDLDRRAIEILKNPPPAQDISNLEDWWGERHIIIRRLLERRDFKGAYELASTHMQKEGFSFAQAEWIAGWLALDFLHDPTRAYQHFERLDLGVKTPVSSARSAYWAGRAAKKLKIKDMEAKWFNKAVQHQTVFYGQLAAKEAGADKALLHLTPPRLSGKERKKAESHELIKAAALLYKAGMKREATTFLWAYVAEQETPEAYIYAVKLAAKMEFYHEAVKLAKKASQKGMFLTRQSYPVITDQMGYAADNLEWALIHALIRQESIFDPQANSPAGAKGLMQLMPATASQTARKLGIKHQVSWLTGRPEHNIRLGSAYLSELLERFDNSYPLAIAAYNAGPARVSKWLKLFGDPRTGEIDMIDWIELIPIYETRNYVQRVMEAVYVYRIILKDKQPKADYPIHIAMPFDQ